MLPILLSKLTRSPSRTFILILIFLVICQLFSIRSRESTSTFGGGYGYDNKGNAYDPCAGLEALDDYFVTLRTGATDAPKKLPPHFTTTLRCVPHYELYSDYEEVVEGHQVHDVLDDVNPEVVASHPDFEYYKRLRAKGREAFSAEEVAKWASAKNTNSGHDSPGWRLDKWKFLPLAEKALRARPQAKWFIFIESDTYVLWKSMVAWLSHFDASQPWYLGQQMQIGDVVFAYGGAGFAISQPALRKVVEHRAANLKVYDDFTAGHWAGDCVLGKALADVGVPLVWAFPTLSSEEPADTDFESGFGGADRHPWCYYVASYHHLPPEEYPAFYNFEQKFYQKNDTFMRHKDVFFNYLSPQLDAKRADWDNNSDKDKTTEGTFKACRSACESDSDCLQFSLAGSTCKTSSTLRLGHKASAAARVQSGWMLDRINSFVERLESECEGRDWVLPFAT